MEVSPLAQARPGEAARSVAAADIGLLMGEEHIEPEERRPAEVGIVGVGHDL
jgi:hypothetical protein